MGYDVEVGRKSRGNELEARAVPGHPTRNKRDYGWNVPALCMRRVQSDSFA